MRTIANYKCTNGGGTDEVVSMGTIMHLKLYAETNYCDLEKYLFIHLLGKHKLTYFPYSTHVE